MSPRTPNFCSNCGATLTASDSFCSHCGTRVESAGTRAETSSPNAFSSTKTSTHAHTPSLQRRVEDFTVEGWEVERDYGDRVVVVDRGFGSIPVHLVLLPTTSGFGNVLYAWYHYSSGAERVELRADGTERSLGGSGRSDSSTGWTLAAALGLLFTLTLGVFAALVGTFVLWVTTSAVATAFGLAFLLASLVSFFLAPQYVPGFESPTTFGTKRSTEEAAVNEPKAACTACSRPVGAGVERTFRQRRYVAGIPVETTNEGTNRYCRSCANGDPFTAESATGRDREFDFA